MPEQPQFPRGPVIPPLIIKRLWSHLRLTVSVNRLMRFLWKSIGHRNTKNDELARFLVADLFPYSWYSTPERLKSQDQVLGGSGKLDMGGSPCPSSPRSADSAERLRSTLCYSSPTSDLFHPINSRSAVVCW